MAIKEIIGASGQGGESPSYRFPYFSTATTPVDAIAEALAAAPTSVAGFPVKSIDVDEEIQNGYECSVTYGPFKPKEPPKVNESFFNFDVTTQSQRIIVPVSPQTIYPATGLTAPTNSAKWLIGQQGDGSPPSGADVQEPIASFSETHYLPSTTITDAHQRTLLRIVGRLNDASFRGWSAKEVLCTGVSGSQRGAEDWEISFRFSVREHQTGLTIAGITAVNKEGWQFLWVRYRTEIDDTEPVLTDVAEYAVVADVFRTADFADLGIGTS